MKILKRILIISFLLLLMFGVGYFVFTGSQLPT